MLSNFTSYLFGSYQNAENAENNPIDFHEIEDDEWMLINKIDKEADLIDDYEAVSYESIKKLKDQSPRQRSRSCKGLKNRRFSSPLRELSPSFAAANPTIPFMQKLSRSSSKSSSQCLMEESWYVTPPPCFISGPYETKPSSLENLLIEQPGVNYLPRMNGGGKPPKRFENGGGESNAAAAAGGASVVKNKNEKTKANLKGNKNSPKNNKKSVAVVCSSGQSKDDKRRQILQAFEEKKFLTTCQSQLNSIQKMEQVKSSVPMKKNQIDRSNLVLHELSSSRRRPRRSDLTKKQHSGVNNDRKCCY